MAPHLLHRFLLTLPAVWLVLTLVFLLIHLVPGDPVNCATPWDSISASVPYGHYLRQIVRGDL